MVKLPFWLMGLVLPTPVALRKQSLFRAEGYICSYAGYDTKPWESCPACLQKGCAARKGTRAVCPCGEGWQVAATPDQK